MNMVNSLWMVALHGRKTYVYICNIQHLYSIQIEFRFSAHSETILNFKHLKIKYFSIINYLHSFILNNRKLRMNRRDSEIFMLFGVPEKFAFTLEINMFLYVYHMSTINIKKLFIKTYKTILQNFMNYIKINIINKRNLY